MEPWTRVSLWPELNVISPASARAPPLVELGLGIIHPAVVLVQGGHGVAGGQVVQLWTGGNWRFVQRGHEEVAAGRGGGADRFRQLLGPPRRRGLHRHLLLYHAVVALVEGEHHAVRCLHF